MTGGSVLGLSPALGSPSPAEAAVPVGVDLHAVISPVSDECHRRARHGLGGIADRSLLRALFELPSDAPVARVDVSEKAWRRITQAPTGVCDYAVDAVTRRLVPAVRLRRFELCARPTVESVHRLSQLAPFAELVLVTVLDVMPTRVMAEARRFGVAIRTQAGVSLLEGIPFRPARHTPAAWLMVERVTDRYLNGANGSA